MTTNLDALERLARAATPGPWTFTAGDESVLAAPTAEDAEYFESIGEEPPRQSVLTRDSGYYTSNEDAGYIAAANPATVLALIAEVRRYRGALERIAAYAQECFDCDERMSPEDVHCMASDGIARAAQPTPDGGE